MLIHGMTSQVPLRCWRCSCLDEHPEHQVGCPKDRSWQHNGHATDMLSPVAVRLLAFPDPLAWCCCLLLAQIAGVHVDLVPKAASPSPAQQLGSSLSKTCQPILVTFSTSRTSLQHTPLRLPVTWCRRASSRIIRSAQPPFTHGEAQLLSQTHISHRTSRCRKLSRYVVRTPC